MVNGKETANFWDIEKPRFAIAQGPAWLKIDPATGVLSGTQGSEHLGNMPFPGRGNVYEIEIITSDESFKVSFAVGVDAWCFLTRFVDQLRRTRALLFHDIANGVNGYLIDSEKFF